MALQIEQRCTEGTFGVTISQGICHDIPSNGNKNWDFPSRGGSDALSGEEGEGKPAVYDRYSRA